MYSSALPFILPPNYAIYTVESNGLILSQISLSGNELTRSSKFMRIQSCAAT